MKKITGILLLFSSFVFFSGCTELQQVANQIPSTAGTGGIGTISSAQISNGLKEALNQGVNEGIAKLSATDGFFGNELTRILLPGELQQVDTTLRKFGLGSLADEGLKLLNRAAEDAVTEASPIFLNAITTMSFNDAKGILLGGENAATNYLSSRTSTQLFTAFKPKVSNSLDKVGASNIWSQIITRYNSLTGKSVTTDLNTYVTEQAINSVFKMVADKEAGIRNNIGLRNTTLLQQVFALQD